MNIPPEFWDTRMEPTWDDLWVEIYRYLITLMIIKSVPPEERTEVAQECIKRLREGRETFEGDPGALPQWLTKLLNRIRWSLDRCRYRRGKLVIWDPAYLMNVSLGEVADSPRVANRQSTDDDDEEWTLSRSLRSALRRCVLQLPKLPRRAILAYFFYDEERQVSGREAAELMKCEEPAARKRLSAGLAALLKTWRDAHEAVEQLLTEEHLAVLDIYFASDLKRPLQLRELAVQLGCTGKETALRRTLAFHAYLDAVDEFIASKGKHNF
ncbi:MAG: sigma-70 family RNA polymerase sigma factor [Verrucomicrobiaceae bacterium]|nr:MAG: sigma-70 family RNA polymerase sigma factor [Verrucomicrobiaceae bacterium]